MTQNYRQSAYRPGEEQRYGMYPPPNPVSRARESVLAARHRGHATQPAVEPVSHRRPVQLPPVFQRGRFHASRRRAPRPALSQRGHANSSGRLWRSSRRPAGCCCSSLWCWSFFPAASGPCHTKSETVKVFALDFHFYGGLLMFALLILEVARSSCDEARPSDREGDPDMAAPCQSSASTRARDRIHHPPGQHRRRRLL